jgi:glycosyltransferase involved in cell wall biosynthesis
MRLLFVNHTGAFSGAEVSLMRLIEGLRPEHQLCLACPADGPLSRAADAAGIARVSLPTIDASLRLHPLQTPVGLAQLAAGSVALARIARRYRPDLIHANSSRAGILAAVARGLGSGPFVVRAHEHIPLTATGRAVRALLLRTAGAIVAVSDFSAAELNRGLAEPVVKRVYNSIDHVRFDPGRVSGTLRQELGLSSGTRLIGQVAQITPWKGQDTSIRATALLRRAGVDVQLALIGDVTFGGAGVRYDNHAYLGQLRDLAHELRVSDGVHFLGRREDVPQILASLDLSLLPSWDEPFGLATIESLAVGTPAFVSAVGAGPELIEDGVTGRILPPHEPVEWSSAVAELLADEAELSTMGARGPAFARRFQDEVQARELLAIYGGVLSSGHRSIATAKGEALWRS